MYTLYLQAVDSRFETDDEVSKTPSHTAEALPENWQLVTHQAATIHALETGDASIIINQAMTGDGKSFAAQYMMFNHGWDTFAMYPTNELARDQHRALGTLLNRWTPPYWKARQRPIDYTLINAAELDALSAEAALENYSRPELMTLMLRNNLILTNPDVFHLAINQFAYRDYGKARDLILAQIAERYRLFVFDEFHLFDTPQIGAIVTAMVLLHELTQDTQQPARFLFLSATPQDRFLELAHKAGLSVQKLGGDYQHGALNPLQGHRRILQPASLHLYEGRLETWVQEHTDLIIRFFKEHRPGAKGVIIANSVATAYRLLALLREVCATNGIKLGSNTGLTPRDERVTTNEVDLLVATSTVDVGVDFRINLLIFESIDAASHIQRLGRLGRHTTDNEGNPFDHFEAHALLPSWVIEALGQQLPDGSEVSRALYTETLMKEEVYPATQSFTRYLQKWSGVQSTHVLLQLSKLEVRAQYAHNVKHLEPIYKYLFPIGRKRYFDLSKDEQTATLDTATSFRGRSPFNVLVCDRSQNHNSPKVVSYNLISLLLNAMLQEVALEDMLARAGKDRRALERSSPLGAFDLYGWLPGAQMRRLYLTINHEIGHGAHEIVVEYDRIRIHTEQGDVGLTSVNKSLEQKLLPTYLIPNHEPEVIRRRLRFGFQVELFKFQSLDGVEGSAAFGRDALLLDSVWQQRRSPQDRPMIF